MCQGQLDDQHQRFVRRNCVGLWGGPRCHAAGMVWGVSVESVNLKECRRQAWGVSMSVEQQQSRGQAGQGGGAAQALAGACAVSALLAGACT
jgi:hypothetical protein